MLICSNRNHYHNKRNCMSIMPVLAALKSIANIVITLPCMCDSKRISWSWQWNCRYLQFTFAGKLKLNWIVDFCSWGATLSRCSGYFVLSNVSKGVYVYCVKFLIFRRFIISIRYLYEKKAFFFENLKLSTNNENAAICIYWRAMQNPIQEIPFNFSCK